MKLTAKGRTDAGIRLPSNQDSMLLDSAMGLFAVADGMGAYSGGGLASRRALEALHETLQRSAPDLLGEDSTLTAILDLLNNTTQRVAREIETIALASHGLRQMGTTMTALFLTSGRGIMLHIGDTKLYLHRRGDLHQISVDHTLATELVRSGVWDHSQAAASWVKNVLTRGLGLGRINRFDTCVFELEPGDTFLLCSDGLTTNLDRKDLLRAFDSFGLRELPQHLIDLANTRGGQDNSTAIVVRVE